MASHREPTKTIKVFSGGPPQPTTAVAMANSSYSSSSRSRSRSPLQRKSVMPPAPRAPRAVAQAATRPRLANRTRQGPLSPLSPLISEDEILGRDGPGSFLGVSYGKMIKHDKTCSCLY